MIRRSLRLGTGTHFGSSRIIKQIGAPGLYVQDAFHDVMKMDRISYLNPLTSRFPMTDSKYWMALGAATMKMDKIEFVSESTCGEKVSDTQ